MTFDPHAEDQLVRPSTTPADAVRVAADLYALEATAKELGSNQDRNYLLSPTSKLHQRYLLKFDNDAFSTREIEIQNEALLRLAQSGLSVPTPVRNERGEWISSTNAGDRPVRARLLTFVEGESLVYDGHLFQGMVRRMGELAGRVVLALADVKDPALERDLQWDMRNAMTVIEAYAPDVDEPRRTQVLKAAREAWKRVQAAGELPVQAIHGDITDDNVVGPRDAMDRVVPTSVIDWGDLSSGWRVAEIAVTVSCLLHHNKNPLDTMEAIKAFDELVPLTDAEVVALWPLVVLRGAVIVASGWHQLALEPDNEYVKVRMEHEWRIFANAARLDHKLAVAAIQAATGRADEQPSVQSMVRVQPAVVRLDSQSPDLHAGAWLEKDIEARVLEKHAQSGSFAVAPYGEYRLTRSSPPGVEPENATLFAELYSSEPLELYAPFDCEVENTFTGLQLKSPSGTVVVGDTTSTVSGMVSTGDAVCTIPAHTITSVQWNRPGTAAPDFVTPSSLPAWRRLTFDPAPLLAYPRLSEPDIHETRADRRAAVPSAAERFYELPPRIERGWRELLLDTSARQYIDMVNNVAACGHGHPHLAKAVYDQLMTLNTNNRFLYSKLAEYVQRLRELAPHPSLSEVLLVNSGSEAVDLALHLAHLYTGRRDVVCLREAYHGWTYASDAVSTSASDNPHALGTRPAWVHVAGAVNSYRGRHRGDGAGKAYAAELITLLDEMDEKTPVGAFIAEPVFGNGGGLTYPPGYLSAAYAAVRKHGGVTIADEVQVGLGRLGSHTWGVEYEGVVPDIMCAAKALGNAYPLGCVYTTKEIAASLARDGMFFSSAGGATGSAAAGIAVLDVIRDEGLQENARTVGTYLSERLEGLKTKHEIIGAVHGLGLYQGVELVKSRNSLEPAVRETAWVCERLLDYGVITQYTSERRNVLKIKPPLTLTLENAAVFVDALDAVLSELAARFETS